MRGASDAMLMLGAAILMVAALWHVYWAFGGRIGMARSIPERHGIPLFVPGSLLTLAVATGIGAVGLLYAAATGVIALPLASPRLVALLTGAAGTVFVIRAIGDFKHVGFFNRGGSTPFAVADRRIYSPLCLFLGMAGLVAAALRLL